MLPLHCTMALSFLEYGDVIYDGTCISTLLGEVETAGNRICYKHVQLVRKHCFACWNCTEIQAGK